MAAIIKEVLKNGIYETGDATTSNYSHYSYSVNAELKQFTIKINTIADVNKFTGSTIFDKTRNRNDYLRGSLIFFKNELLSLLLIENIDYIVNLDNNTITFKETGYNKLLTKKEFPDLLKIVTFLFTLQHAKPHTIAEIINDIMVNNKYPYFRVIPNSNDNSVHELYADGGSSESLAKQLRDAFRTAVLSMLNQADGRPKAPVTEDKLQDADQLSNVGKLSVSFNKYIALSKYMYELIIRESNEIKSKKPEPETEPEELASKSRIKFADGDEKIESISAVKTKRNRKTVQIEAKKRLSLSDSVYQMINNDKDDIEAWQHAITTGLGAQVEALVPTDQPVTIENKYSICQKIEMFFLDKNKINNIKLMNLLFRGLLPLKDDINVHKHETIDALMFKKNTDSWQKLLKSIRERAFELLTEEIDGKTDMKALEILHKYREAEIFNLHRANAFFMKFGRTKTVKKIDTLIEERQKSIIEKSQAAITIK